MNNRSRREFLEHVGRGMLVAGLGSAAALELGVSRCLAEERNPRLTSHKLAPLVSSMQETPPEKLLAARPSPGTIWPAFRGTGNSLTAATDLPLHWSDTENIAWSIELPGYGQSSPVVWHDAVFVTTMQGDNKQTPTILCFDLATGEKRWQREFRSSQEVPVSHVVSRSAPTPVVDGNRIYASFESGDLIALDHVGKVVWERSLVHEYGSIKGTYGIGSSLAASDVAIFVLMNHEGPSYLLAADKATGKNLWKVDYAGRIAWSSPIVHHRRDGRDEIVVSAAGLVEAYDAASGARIWKLDGLSGNTVPSATAAGAWIFIGSQDVSSNLAIDLNSGAPVIAWRGKKPSCDFMSPLVFEGRAYYVNQTGVAFCVDAETGRTIKSRRLEESCWASPLGATDRVYFVAKNGQTVVTRAGDELEILADNKLTLDDGMRIFGVAAVDGALLLRAGTRLICVGKPIVTTRARGSR
jgi:outer membrane protein assembly factor BamB